MKAFYPILAALLIALASGTSLCSYAQRIQFGIELGASYSRFLYEDRSSITQFWNQWEQDGKLSGNIMAFAIVPVESIYAFQIGLRYHEIGNTFRFNSDASLSEPSIKLPYMNSLTLQYLSIPLRIRSPLIDNSLFYFVGAEFSYLASINEALFPSRDFDFSIRDYLSSYNISLIGALGYQFIINQKRVYIQGMYGHGLGNPGKQLGRTWGNQEISLSAGYLFK